MKLNRINIHNFKCFEDVSIELHPRLNVLMGNNGTGKSSLLEAFRILIGSLYLGYDKYENKIAMPGIVKDDIRLRNIEDSLEPQIPAYVYAEGELSHHYILYAGKQSVYMLEEGYGNTWWKYNDS